MGRKLYKVPTTELFRVELEGTFASSVVQNDPQSSIETTGHEINSIDKGEDWEWGDTSWGQDN